MTSSQRGRRAKPWNPNRPLRPAAAPVFYGWFILAAASIGVLASIPGQTMGVSVFSDHLIAATGLSRVGLSNAYLVGTLTSGLLLPLGGRFLDRFGERRTAVSACALLGLALAWLALSERTIAGGAAYISSVQRSTVAFAVLALGFVVLRFSGQGMLTLASRNMVPKWFERRRGLVAGMMGIFVSLGFSLAPNVLAAWIESAGGWKNAWLQMAGVMGIGMAAFAWAFFRDDPEMCGLRMDGDSAPRAPADEAEEPELRVVDLRGALKSGAFWSVTLALAIQSGMVTGMTFHIVDVGAEAGLEQAEVLRLFPPIAIVGVLVGLGVGAASDRVRLRFVMAFYLLALTIGYTALSRLGVLPYRIAAIAGLGMASGCFSTLMTMASAKLFGRAHLGSISSTQMSLLVIASAIGPSLFAQSRVVTGSYATALLAGACLPVLVLVLTLFSRDPARADSRVKPIW